MGAVAEADAVLGALPEVRLRPGDPPEIRQPIGIRIAPHEERPLGVPHEALVSRGRGLGIDPAVVVLPGPVAVPPVVVHEEVVRVVVRIAPGVEGRVAGPIGVKPAGLEVGGIPRGVGRGRRDVVDLRVVGIPVVEVRPAVDGAAGVLPLPEIAIGTGDVALGEAAVGPLHEVVVPPVDAVEVDMDASPVGTRLPECELHAPTPLVPRVLRPSRGTPPWPPPTASRRSTPSAGQGSGTYRRSPARFRRRGNRGFQDRLWGGSRSRTPI